MNNDLDEAQTLYALPEHKDVTVKSIIAENSQAPLTNLLYSLWTSVKHFSHMNIYSIFCNVVRSISENNFSKKLHHLVFISIVFTSSTHIVLSDVIEQDAKFFSFYFSEIWVMVQSVVKLYNPFCT